jgi:ABC-2 type transport system permease protein
MFRKDLRLAYRNPVTFGLLIATPFLLIAVLSEAFSPLFEGRSTFEVPVVDLAGTAQSTALIDDLDGLESLQIERVEWSGETFTGEDAAELIEDDSGRFAVIVVQESPDVEEPAVTLYGAASQPGFTKIIQDNIASRLASGAAGDDISESADVAVEPAVEGQVVPSRFEQTVPGFSVMFTFWLAMLVATSIYVEKKEYRTWRRTLTSPASGWIIVSSRVTAYVFLGLAQMLIMFTLGGIFFGIDIGWNLPALIAIFAALALVTTGFGFLMSSLIKDMAILSMVMNLMIIVMAGLGGALVPATFLPGWAEGLSAATPHYWAMDGIQEVIIAGAGLTSVATQVGALLVFAAVFFLLGSLRFRVSE